MMKKIISALLCIAMTLNLIAVSVSAEGMSVQTVSANEGIIEALRLIEPVKKNYGLTEADLENMEVAGPIKTYEYTSEGISFLRNYFPLVCGNELAAWAIEDIDGDEVFYQISTAYIDEVNEIVDSAMAFALIYDANCCCLFDGVGTHKLGSYEKIGSRFVLTENTLDISDVELGNIYETYDLGYTCETVTYGVVLPETTYKCDALHITQNGYTKDNLCWAASIACIVDCVKNTYYTAWDVYTQTKGLGNLDSSGQLNIGKEEEILKWYGLSYQYREYVPVFSNIETNIINGYPLYANFAYGSPAFPMGHACVIYGTTRNNQNSNLNYIHVMDPATGYTTAQYYPGTYNTYKYISAENGEQMQLYTVDSRY